MQRLYENIRQWHFLWDNRRQVILSMVPQLIYQKIRRYGFRLSRFIEIRIFIRSQIFSIQKDLLTKQCKPDMRCIIYLLVMDQEIALVKCEMCRFKYISFKFCSFFCFYTKIYFNRGTFLVIIIFLFSGARFAVYQTKIGLIKILQNYKFETCDKTQIPYVIDPKAFLLAPKDGIHLRIIKINRT